MKRLSWVGAVVSAGALILAVAHTLDHHAASFRTKVAGISNAIAYVSRHRDPNVASFPAAADSLLAGFRSGAAPDVKSYNDLFLYFVEGFETYRTPLGANAIYPGFPSRNGPASDRLEGFSRIVPLMGAWVHSGRPDVVKLNDGSVVDLDATFRRGLIAGTDPQSPEYWGQIHDYNQRIVEASDIALALWLYGNRVWPQLTPAQQNNVAAWLGQVEGKRVSDNNWHLYPVFINSVLNSVGAKSDRTDALQNYRRFKEFYRGDGWFSDGPGGVFDYYNDWSIHYQLYWLDQVDPTWDLDFISRSRRQFLVTYQYLFGPHGFPMIGRSVCYRMAAPVALIFGQQTDPDVVTAGEARRALDVTWSDFIRKGGVRSSSITQGFCGPDPRILDNYSGPASCLWGLRSLIVAFALPEDSRFWTAPPGKLPVETASYSVKIPELGWTITGNHSTGTIEIHKLGEPVPPNVALQDYGLVRRVASAVLWRPFRPENHEAKYGFDIYDSARPFCGCAP